MTIQRIINGETIEIELNSEELEKAYRKRDREYHIEDIRLLYERQEKECPYNDNELDTIAEMAEENMDEHDAYWDCYWSCFESAIKQYGGINVQ